MPQEPGKIVSPSPRPCPVCGKPVQFAFRPFCSAACTDRDLHHWFAGTYRLPAGDEDDAPEPEAGENMS